MLRHHRIPDCQRRSAPLTDDPAHLGPAFGRRDQRRLIPLGITGRRQRDEHPVDIRRPHRIGLAGQQEPAVQIREIERNLGIVRIALGIVPQPHEPAARIARRVPPLDRQRRPVQPIERYHPARSPLEPQPALPKIPRCLIGQQRMIVRVLRLPDQPGQIPLPIEDRIHPQRIRRGRDHRSHHRPRKIHRPEARIEPLDEPLHLLVGAGSKPVAHRSSPSRMGRGTMRSMVEGPPRFTLL